MGDLINSTINNLKKRRENIIKGNINSIESPFKRFKKDFIGIEQEQYVIVSASTKGGKSQFVSFMYVFYPILYAYENRDKLKLKIIYFNLEESSERITHRFMSYLLYKLSNCSIRIAPSDLRSTDNNKPLPEKVINLLESKKYQDILNFFEETVIFESEGCNPTGMYKKCREVALNQGTVITKKVKYGDVEHETFSEYIPNDPKLYTIVITDHIALIEKERGFTDKQTIDKWSEYALKYLRTRYKFTVIDIQQQNFESEGLDAQKLNKIEGSVATLGDSKYTARNANLVLGLYSPYRFEIPSHKGYDITKFRDNIRFLKVYVNRDGGMGGVCPLYFDGAVCYFRELPRPEDKEGITKVYNQLQHIRQEFTNLFLAYSINSTHLNNNTVSFIEVIKNYFINFALNFKKLWQK